MPYFESCQEVRYNMSYPKMYAVKRGGGEFDFKPTGRYEHTVVQREVCAEGATGKEASRKLDKIIKSLNAWPADARYTKKHNTFLESIARIGKHMDPMVY